MRSSDRTRASSSAWSNGLVMKSSAPASIAATFSWSPLAVIITIGRKLRRRVGAQPPADLVAVHPRHDDVEQDEVGRLGGDLARAPPRPSSRPRTA